MTIARPLLIHAYPARKNRAFNPFNYLLAEALTSYGCVVIDPGIARSILERSDIVHLHWPEHAASGSFLKVLRRSLTLLVRIAIQRSRGSKIVWTVHNVRGHDNKARRFEKILMSLVCEMVDGAIFLNAASRDEAYIRFPALSTKPAVLIPHGLYGSHFKERRSLDDARSFFGLPDKQRVISFLGDIKSYKGLDLLLSAFGDLNSNSVALLIAGIFFDDEYAADIRGKIADLRHSGRSVVFHERRLDDSELMDALKASDVVVLPYRAVWSSGFALVALESGARLVTSDAPAFRDLERELGTSWVRVAASGLTATSLSLALETRAPEDARTRMIMFKESRAWPTLAAQTVAFYRQLISRKKGP